MVKPLHLVAVQRTYVIRLFGAFGLSRNGQELDVAGWQRRPLVLLRLLAAHGGKVARDQVIDLLWPDSSPEAGGADLRVLIHRLRRLLGDDPPPVQIQGGWVLLNPALGWEIDLVEFERALHDAGEGGVPLQRALERYGGEPLVEDQYEDWAVPIRERVQRSYRAGTLRMVEQLRMEGRVGKAVGLLERLLDTDPLDETVFRLLLEALSESGRRSDIRREYARFAQRLKGELDLEPEEETARLVKRLQAPAAVTPGVEASRLPAGLMPSQSTPFIGREGEIAVVRDLFNRDGVRLVTLTGPGGSGKTRLAVEVAGRLGELFPDGTAFINLAPLNRADLVGPTIVATLELPRSPAPPREHLIGRLRQANALLILDNFEQVLEAGTLVAELLAACPYLRVLVTSRERLRLRAEYEYSVPPLALPPDERRTADPEELARYDSIAFFLDRAGSVRSSFRLTPENAAAVIDICQRLDGIPLALELAAARMRLFSPEQVLARLDRPLALLTDGPRDLPQRQQTLRATIDWSYRLLSTEEQTLFVRLAVFAGGWTLEAAEAVCNIDGKTSVFARLGSLVEKSLVRCEEARRFGMLETLREYAAERLTERSERERLGERHAAWVMALVGIGEPEPAERAAWYRSLDPEVDNIRAALEWVRDSGHPEAGLRIIVNTAMYWVIRGPVTERERLLDAMLAVEGEVDRRILARALPLAGATAPGQRRDMLERALSMARELQDVRLEVECLLSLSTGEANADDPDRAEARAEEAVELSRKLGDQLMISAGLDMLASLAAARGDIARACDLGKESARIILAVGDAHQATRILSNLANFAMRNGDPAQARKYLLEALNQAEPAGYKGAPTYLVETAAGVAVLSGRIDLGARLIGAAETARIQLGWKPHREERAAIEIAASMGTAALGVAEWEETVAAGRALTAVDSADLIRELCQRYSAGNSPDVTPSHGLRQSRVGEQPAPPAAAFDP